MPEKNTNTKTLGTTSKIEIGDLSVALVILIRQDSEEYRKKRSIKEKFHDRHEKNEGKDKEEFYLPQGLGKTDSTIEIALHSAELS